MIPCQWSKREVDAEGQSARVSGLGTTGRRRQSGQATYSRRCARAGRPVKPAVGVSACSLTKSGPGATHELAAVAVCNHVAVGLLRSVDARLGTLDGERKGVHDNERPVENLALEKTHDFIDAARPGVDNLAVRATPEGREVGAPRRKPGSVDVSVSITPHGSGRAARTILISAMAEMRTCGQANIEVQAGHQHKVCGSAADRLKSSSTRRTISCRPKLPGAARRLLRTSLK